MFKLLFLIAFLLLIQGVFPIFKIVRNCKKSVTINGKNLISGKIFTRSPQKNYNYIGHTYEPTDVALKAGEVYDIREVRGEVTKYFPGYFDYRHHIFFEPYPSDHTFGYGIYLGLKKSDGTLSDGANILDTVVSEISKGRSKVKIECYND